MFDFFTRLFRSEPSGAKAKERLRLVLLSDHLALAPDVVEALKTDLLEVISRYVEVDIDHADVTFEQRDHDVAMLANVPIISVRNDRPRAAHVVATNGVSHAAPLPAGVDASPLGGDAEVPPTLAADEADEALAGSDASLALVPVPEPVPAQTLSSKPRGSRPRKRKRRRAQANAAAASSQPAAASSPPPA
jgi:cell division topological specificity factor